MNDMSSTQKFIEDAIAGGWHPTYRTLPHLSKFRSDKEVLLDPLAWQAVGKTRGWEYEPLYGCLKCGMDADEEWRHGYVVKMHRLVDALCSGLTIEEALSKIT